MTAGASDDHYNEVVTKKGAHYVKMLKTLFSATDYLKRIIFFITKCSDCFLLKVLFIEEYYLVLSNLKGF